MSILWITKRQVTALDLSISNMKIFFCQIQQLILFVNMLAAQIKAVSNHPFG